MEVDLPENDEEPMKVDAEPEEELMEVDPIPSGQNPLKTHCSQAVPEETQTPSLPSPQMATSMSVMNLPFPKFIISQESPSSHGTFISWEFFWQLSLLWAHPSHPLPLPHQDFSSLHQEEEGRAGTGILWAAVLGQ